MKLNPHNVYVCMYVCSIPRLYIIDIFYSKNFLYRISLGYIIYILRTICKKIYIYYVSYISLLNTYIIHTYNESYVEIQICMHSCAEITYKPQAQRRELSRRHRLFPSPSVGEYQITMSIHSGGLGIYTRICDLGARLLGTIN